jgi:hypothetical protein
LLNSDGELRAIMGLTGDGSPVLQFLDKRGEPAWTAGSPDEGSVSASADADTPERS